MFGTKLERFKYAGSSYRDKSGEIFIPKQLAMVITGVLGIDNRPLYKPHFLPLKKGVAELTSYYPTQVAGLYRFPSGLDGSNQVVALIELGGGYTKNDLSEYLSQLSPPIQSPNIRSVHVGGGGNNPTGDPDGPDGAVMLDLEVVASIAPKADIVVYFARPDDKGMLDAVNAAVHDSNNMPSIISISWGAPELDHSQQAMRALNQSFAAAPADWYNGLLQCRRLWIH